MIKAVFFDWFNTLAIYHPPREELQSKAIQENGYSVSPETVKPALSVADEYFFEVNAESPIRLRTDEEQTSLYTNYENILLTELGIDVSDKPELALDVYYRARELYKGIGFKLFEDVIPTLEQIKEHNLTTGLITNIEYDMKPVCDKLGLSALLDFIVTSGEAGSDKPEPGIFLTALKKAEVEPSEALHVGDQYKTDVVGARGVGIEPVFLDRFDHYPEVDDCPRVSSLEQVLRFV